MMASVIVLIGLFVTSLIIASYFNSYPLICSLISTFLCLFIYEWYNVHGDRLTLKRRACFDVSNVLETYQTRARTLGHLFKPDPPTPGVSFAAGPVETNPSRSTEFNTHRDSHYANMYEKAIKLAKEMEAIDFPMVDAFKSGSTAYDDYSDDKSLDLSFGENSISPAKSTTSNDLNVESEDLPTARSLHDSDEEVPTAREILSSHSTSSADRKASKISGEDISRKERK
ncbi:unnamed protein product [Auanema sp. JU1783]|nr:unnamed protein product [Auanema sp. JU1783]